MIIGRRFDNQATILARQGLLSAYPPCLGQEACQVGAAVALDAQDWLFPTYRDSVAMLTRGVTPLEALTSFRGEWHSGHDPNHYRIAPRCTPLATHMPHAVGLAFSAKCRGEDSAVLVLLGDGAVSEGDAHEAFNLAAVWQVPVVFLIQNNGYAISVPSSMQSAAPSLACKGVGYGMPGELIDGNDVVAVFSRVRNALNVSRSGGGPRIIEALTYRAGPHTTSDDPTKYRDTHEHAQWLLRDPVARMERFLVAGGVIDDHVRDRMLDIEHRIVDEVRNAALHSKHASESSLTEHVYALP
ncbi:pyruvate dehydrogenase (acetyl-transferring) E1 component subunit alpha [Nocardia abscessus]|uniref:thiamine pyrophosphate-dependent enzyme n=1 Tax=Nocardia abscessus TaxID=120957 RepID=UPI0018963A48|nr:pyruvate dehydrogenase (acetyl-transferring) E1 component subunit alpha [Nocardia abscessus]